MLATCQLTIAREQFTCSLVGAPAADARRVDAANLASVKRSAVERALISGGGHLRAARGSRAPFWCDVCDKCAAE